MALFCNLLELVEAITLLVGHHFLVALAIRVILALLQDELGIFFHGNRNSVLSSPLDFLNAFLFTLKHLLCLDYLAARVLDEEVLDGVVGVDRVRAVQESTTMCLVCLAAWRSFTDRVT